VGLADIAKLSALGELELWGTGISDAGLAHLVSLKKLTTVDVSDTRVTHRSRSQLRQALPGCRVQ